MSQDKFMIFCDDLDINGVATTETISDNVFDIDDSQRKFTDVAGGDPVNLNAHVNDLGRAGHAFLHCAVGTTEWFSGTSVATVDIILYEHTTTTVTSGTGVISVNIPGIAVTGSQNPRLVAGSYLFGLRLPPDLWGDTTNIYIGLAALVNTQTLTQGTLNAWLGDAYGRRM